MRCFEMRLLGGFAPMRRGVLDEGSAAARANNGMSDAALAAGQTPGRSVVIERKARLAALLSPPSRRRS
jgi:hypothetical protein